MHTLQTFMHVPTSSSEIFLGKDLVGHSQCHQTPGCQDGQQKEWPATTVSDHAEIVQIRIRMTKMLSEAAVR